MSVNTLAWYYIPDLDPDTGIAHLTGEEWHHARHVMRMQAGDQLIIFNGRGRAFEAELVHAGKSDGEMRMLREASNDFAVNNPLTLAIGFAPTKNIDRVEYAVEKLTEIGVSRITFLDCEHGERAHIRMDRMHKIVVSAAKQSRKLILPDMVDITPLMEAVAAAEQSRMTVLACHLDESSAPFYKNYSPSAGVMLLVGPEGGFSANEIISLRSAGVPFITLGEFRLRAETAAIVAAAQASLLQAMK